jgi:hypothetical protein
MSLDIGLGDGWDNLQPASWSFVNEVTAFAVDQQQRSSA